MNIEFTSRTIPTDDGGVMFQALVDGKSIVCRVSAEALQGHFGGGNAPDSPGAMNLIAFARGRTRIHAAASRMIGEGQNPVVVMYDDIGPAAA